MNIIIKIENEREYKNYKNNYKDKKHGIEMVSQNIYLTSKMEYKKNGMKI